MKAIFAATAALLVLGGGTARAAVTLTTGSALVAPALFNGFEALPATTSHVGPHAEGGITIDFVGAYSGIATEAQVYEGVRSWYAYGGGHGYTRVTRTGGGDFGELSFAAGSGWLPGGPVGNLLYEILDDGVVVASGNAGPLPIYEAGWLLFRVGGGRFDEVRLQGGPDAVLAPGAVEGGIYDAFAGNPAAGAPEPAVWALLLGGFGALGAVARRRRAAARPGSCPG